MFDQVLTLTLDGMTASDYLTYFTDPEPAALGHVLRAVAVDADPLGGTLRIALTWSVPPSAARSAAALAGFPLSPEVDAVAVVAPGERRRQDPAGRPRRPRGRTRVAGAAC